jgi:hypothetical protein
MHPTDPPDAEKSTPHSTHRSPEPEKTLTTVEALEQAQTLLGCFRHGKADNPVVYGSAIARVLSMYPPEIVRFVCDPCTGLPGKLDWMPSVAEVKAACEARAEELAKRHRYQNWGKSIAVHRAAILTDEPVKPTIEELHAKYGKTWGIDAGDGLERVSKAGCMTPEQILEHYRTHGLGKKRKQDPAKPEANPGST